jgi:hypothetical protein
MRGESYEESATCDMRCACANCLRESGEATSWRPTTKWLLGSAAGC